MIEISKISKHLLFILELYHSSITTVIESLHNKTTIDIHVTRLFQQNPSKIDFIVQQQQVLDL